MEIALSFLPDKMIGASFTLPTLTKETDRMTSAGRSPFRFERAVWAAYAIVWGSWYALKTVLVESVDLEQLTTGNLARGLVDGLVMSPWYYQHQTVGHGSMIYGFLLAPLYKYVGSYFLWPKLLAGLFAAGGMALWISIVRKAWGFQAALMFAVWWLMPPPCLADILHVVYANHMESIFWSGLLVTLFVHENSDLPRRLRIGLAAFIAGFASFFCPQNLAISAALFTAAMLRRGRTAPWRILFISGPFLCWAFPRT